MSRPETIACRAAIQQALFFHFQLSMGRIAELMDLDYSTVYCNVWRTRKSNQFCLGWKEREYQEEAIEAAGELLSRQEV